MGLKLEYLPYSKKVLDENISLAMQGKIPLLDLELTTACYHGACIYCDSYTSQPNSNLLNMETYRTLILDALPYGLKWIFICGLGEPSDYEHFLEFVGFCSSVGVNTSFFTHTMNFEDRDLDFLRRNNANMIMKCDSFRPEVFDFLPGKPESSRKILNNLEYLLSSGFVLQEGASNLALSIVVTKRNLDEVPEIVEFCKANNIFPSVGQLEFAGKAKTIYNDLVVADDDLISLKATLASILGYEYTKPLCPANFSGIHLDAYGNCLVDYDTGLNCGWFLLKDTNYRTIGNIHDSDISSLWTLVKECRDGKYDQTVSALESKADFIIGGCGGCISKVCAKLKVVAGGGT